MLDSKPLLYVPDAFFRKYEHIHYEQYECIRQIAHLKASLPHYPVNEWTAIIMSKDDLMEVLSLAAFTQQIVNLVVIMREPLPSSLPNNIQIIPLETWLNKSEQTKMETPKATPVTSEPVQPREVPVTPKEPVISQQQVAQTDGQAPRFIDDFILQSGGENLSPHEPVKYEDNPVYTKTRNIQRKLFAQSSWSNHKIIGIWSPTGHTTATTLTINLALYLANKRIYTSVLEGITTNPALKTHLMRYSTIPEDWQSYASCIQEEHDPSHALWLYQNVVFLPTQAKDLAYTWSPPLIEAYMTAPKITDVTLVDMPSGSLSDYSKDAFQFVDEIWLVFDDNYHALYKWKNVVQQMQQQYNLPIYGIQGRTYSFSKPRDICKELNIPLLTSIPALDEIAMKSYYTKKPLIQVPTAAAALEKPYATLRAHLNVDSNMPSLDLLSKNVRGMKKWLNFLKLQLE